MLAPLWNTHRHRMAPEIAARVEAEIAAQNVRVVACNNVEAREDAQGKLAVTLTSNHATHALNPSRILNCTGLSLSLTRSENPLLKQLLAARMIEEHATGVGLVADAHYRAWGLLHPNLYCIGSLLTGQLLESTAVPELRVQAAGVAKNLLQAIRP
jgi:uncharacterized NAD(P)/FAD-binding protein YdhS